MTSEKASEKVTETVAETVDASAKSKESDTVVMIVSGKAIVMVDGVRYMPDEEFEVERRWLSKPGIKSLIFKGDIEIKNDVEATKAIRDEMEKKRKKDQDAQKTLTELEDGGEYK